MSMKVERFEDLIAWQKAMDLAVRAYEISRDAPFSRDFVLRDQFHGAAISIPSNIAEGFERGSRSEFHHFLTIAKSSGAELRTHLHLARRIGYIGQPSFCSALEQAEEVSRIIGKLRVSVGKNRPGAR